MIQAIILCAIIAWAGYQTGRNRGLTEGYGYGREVGIDEGWNEAECDRLTKEYARDRARRNRLGQYRGKSEVSP